MDKNDIDCRFYVCYINTIIFDTFEERRKHRMNAIRRMDRYYYYSYFYFYRKVKAICDARIRMAA